MDCPRDHHTPPFLPFALPVHERLHIERFPDHRIRWWCWDHMAIEPEGDEPLPEESVTEEVGLGLCVRDSNVWVWTADRQSCLLCGRAAAFVIPVGETGAEPSGAVGADGSGAPAPAPSTTFWLPCPKCGQSLELNVTPDNVYFSPPSELAGSGPTDVGAGNPPASGEPVTDGEHTASQAEPPAGALDDETYQQEPATSENPVYP